jgi:hypothetical protein
MRMQQQKGSLLDAFCWFELGTSKLLLNIYPDKLSRQQSGT